MQTMRLCSAILLMLQLFTHAIANAIIQDQNNYARLHELENGKTGNFINSPQAEKAAREVEATINEVQRLLAMDPTMPRLTRGEIEELFENVTREEMQRSIITGDSKRANHMRALMSALPYHEVPQQQRPFLPPPPAARAVLVQQRSPPKSPPVQQRSPSAQRPVRVTTTTEKPASINPLPPLFLPAKKPTTIRPTTYRPIYTKLTTTAAPPVAPTRRYGDVDVNGNPITFTYKPLVEWQPPKETKSVQDILADIEKHNQKVYKAFVATSTTLPPPLYTPPPTFRTFPTKKRTTKMSKDMEQILQSLGVIESKAQAAPQTFPQFVEIPRRVKETEHTGNAVNSNFGLPYSKNYFVFDQPFDSFQAGSEVRPQYVKAPVSTTTTTTTKPVDHQFKPLPEFDPNKLSKQMKEILVSYGLVSDDTKTTGLKPIIVPDDDLPDIEFVTTPSPRPTRASTTTQRPTRASTTTQKPTTTTTAAPRPGRTRKSSIINPNAPVPDHVVSLLDTLGIQKPLHQYSTTTTTTTEAPSTTKKFVPRRYTSPTKASAGRTTTAKFSYARGIAPRKRKTTTVEVTTPTNIFNPHEMEKTSLEDLDKLQSLMKTLRRLSQVKENFSESRLNKIVDNFNITDSLLGKGPDPVEVTYILPQKNEIKRQEPSSKEEPTKINLNLEISETSETSSTTESEERALDDIDMDNDEEKTETTTTTERSASADELKDSFPNDTDPDEPIDEELPPPRKNGFYFLADWNSFLEVGQDDQKVIVKFDPKVGDPGRFIPVEIPSRL